MQTHSILIVDDDPDVRAMLSRMLVCGGYVVDSAADGPEALDKIRGNCFNLVITDVRLPQTRRKWKNLPPPPAACRCGAPRRLTCRLRPVQKFAAPRGWVTPCSLPFKDENMIGFQSMTEARDYQYKPCRTCCREALVDRRTESASAGRSLSVGWR